MLFRSGISSGSGAWLYLYYFGCVDVEGKVIESIAGDGPRELYQPCSQAIGNGTFSPIIEGGKPRSL